ncbi:hypothetical protein CPAV1605_562 [seawater metagenome]|uniref:Uncharacterized protein n=1 Tax=seawater metagenome TaxID=1561972 RepID=A0A5E8CID9_9ZZZZ
MIQLPKEIWSYIYTFDPTYYNKYDQVIKEFNYVNEFWGIKFHNPNVSDRMSSNKVRTTYSKIKDLDKYWNKDFIQYKFISASSLNLYLTSKGVCSPRHHVDNNKWGNYWKVLLNNINVYSYLNSKKLIY